MENSIIKWGIYMNTTKINKLQKIWRDVTSEKGK